jgi:hypothetical protein
MVELKELNAAKDRGDPNAIAYFKATDAKGRQAALNKFKESGKFSKTVDEYLSNPDNYKNIEADLNGITRRTTKDDEPGLVSQAFTHMLGALGIREADKAKPEKGADILERVGGIKGGDMADNARLAGRAYDAATSGAELTTSNIEDRLAKDANLQEISKATGITNPQDLLKYIKKTSRSVADEQLVGLTTNALKVKGKGAEAIKAAGERNGGTFFDQNAIDTRHLDDKEALMATMATKEKANMIGSLQEKLKSGHLDFSGYQNSLNSLDNKESVTKFEKAVDKFAKAVDDSPEASTSTAGKQWFGGIFSSPETTQKVMNK